MKVSLPGQMITLQGDLELPGAVTSRQTASALGWPLACVLDGN